MSNPIQYRQATATDLPAADRLRLPCFFQDHLLLQQKRPIGVWGIDRPGTTITVTLTSSSLGEPSLQGQAVARASDGFWRVELPALDASFQRWTLTVSGSSEKTFSDVVVGELFLAAGQSNMYFLTKHVIGGRAMVDDASRPFLRMLWMPFNPGENGVAIDRPQFDYPHARWCLGTSGEDIGEFSAVAYSYARKIYDTLNAGSEVPVGIIDISMGSLCIEAYLSRASVEGNPAVLEAVRRGGWYRSPEDMQPGDPMQMTTFFNTKLVPLCGMNLRGLLWYQGESNHPHADDYALLLQTMLDDFSDAFDCPEGLSGILSHIAPHHAMVNDGDRYEPIPYDRWPQINQAIHEVVQRHPNRLFEVPIYDIPTIAQTTAYLPGEVAYEEQVVCETVDHPIHPITKKAVGERMAAVALGYYYGCGRVLRPPVLRDFAAEEGRVFVQFDEVGEGLKTTDGGPVRGFEVCASDTYFAPARACIIAKDTVEVTAPFDDTPAGVSYAFDALNGLCNLCSSDGMPAVPFWKAPPECPFTHNHRSFFYTDRLRIFVNTGHFHDYGSLDGLKVRYNDYLTLPMTMRGSGFYDAWLVSPVTGAGSGSFAIDESGQAIRLSYRPDGGVIGFGPCLQYPGEQNSFHTVAHMTIELRNEDDREKTVGPLRLLGYDGWKAFLPLTADSPRILLPGGDYTAFTFLFEPKNERGEALSPEKRNKLLQTIQAMELPFGDTAPGSLRFRGIRFRPRRIGEK